MYPRKEGQIQPLHWAQLPSWITLDMELRGRLEDRTSFGYISGENRLYELTRVHGGLTVRPTSWLTGYLQFQDEHALGLPLRDVAPNMRNTFDLRQGYFELGYKGVHLRTGRQELRFGDERVIGISDWANTSRTWDGFNLWLGDRNRLDIFSTSVVAIHPSSLDTHGRGLTFHGVEATLTTVIPKTSIQPFVLVHSVPHIISQQGIPGTEIRVSFGSYYETKLPFGFDFSGTGILQRGSYSNNSIHAGSAIIRDAYTATVLPFTPRLEGEYDYATGNPHTDDFRIGTYDQQYPSNHNAFGLVDLFGFQNIKQNRLSLSLTPRTNLLLLFQGGSLHLASVRDAVYASNGTSMIKAPINGFAHDDIGSEFDASAKYILHQSFVTNIGVGHFFPGAVMTESARGTPITVAYLQFTYRFKIASKLADNCKV